MTSHFFPRDEYFMRLALREAERAMEHDDVPIGAVVVHDGEVLATGRNEREERQDPTAHAEILALREAAEKIGSWRVLDSVLYVTLEPCAMCAGAIVLARVPRVVFGAWDPKAGAAGSVLDVLAQPQTQPSPRRRGRTARGGVRCAAVELLRGAAASRCSRYPFAAPPGGVAERLNAAVSKTVMGGFRPSRVRIPPPPSVRTGRGSSPSRRRSPDASGARRRR